MSRAVGPPRSDSLCAHGWHTAGSAGTTGHARFFGALLARRLPWKSYADLLAQHFFIYESLEQAGEAMAGDPVARAFLRPGLIRLPALVADLRFLRGASWAAQIVALPSTTIYCTRLREAAFHRPSALAAHHYTRYIDDVSVGRRLVAAVAAAYGLDGPGRLFVTADGLDIPTLREHYRRVIEALAWPPAEVTAFQAEVGYAHQLYDAVLDELGQKWA